jgi:hypothetical protein
MIWLSFSKYEALDDSLFANKFIALILAYISFIFQEVFSILLIILWFVSVYLLLDLFEYFCCLSNEHTCSKISLIWITISSCWVDNFWKSLNLWLLILLNFVLKYIHDIKMKNQIEWKNMK